VPETIWTRPDRRPRGPEPEHSRATIGAAAIALADAGGLAAASMRAVAAALGTGAGSLYRYLTSRDELLDLMLDATMAELRLEPGPPDPIEALLAVAHQVLAVYRRHPWILEVRQQASAPGPHVLGYFEHCLTVMAPLRSTQQSKMEAIAMITGVVNLFVRNEQTATTYDLSTATPQDHPHLLAALAAPAVVATPRPDLFDQLVRSMLTSLLEPPSARRRPRAQ
jgi:AcrR family transcriptional regulator